MRFGFLFLLSFLAVPALSQNEGQNAAWDVPVPAQMGPELNSSEPSPAPRPPALGDNLAGAGWRAPPIPVDVTQIQVVQALEDVAGRTRAAQAAHGLSIGAFEAAQVSNTVGQSKVAEQLTSDPETLSSINQLVILLATMDNDEVYPGQTAQATGSSNSGPADEAGEADVLAFHPLAEAGAPLSKWAIARRVGRDVLVLARYALVAHADAYDLTHPPSSGSDEKQPEEVWSRKAISVVDNLIAFLDFIEERLPPSQSN